MKVRNTLIALACVCSGVIVWCLRSPNDSAILDETLATKDRAPSATLESPQSPERAQVELPPEPTPIAEGTEAPPLVESDAQKASALYSVKYAKSTLAELVVARYDLDKRVASEVARITKDILASGDMETTIVRPGESAPGFGTKPGGPPVVAGVLTFGGLPLEDGSTISKRRVIETEKYPEFHALQMEAWWVDSAVRQRERLAR
jgi:hypothetical protein